MESVACARYSVHMSIWILSVYSLCSTLKLPTFNDMCSECQTNDSYYYAIGPYWRLNNEIDSGRADTIVFSIITQSWQCWHYVLFRSEKKNKFSKKFTSSMDWTCPPWTLGPPVIHSHAFPTELTWQEFIEGHLSSLTVLVHQLTIGLMI